METREEEDSRVRLQERPTGADKVSTLASNLATCSYVAPYQFVVKQAETLLQNHFETIATPFPQLVILPSFFILHRPCLSGKAAIVMCLCLRFLLVDFSFRTTGTVVILLYCYYYYYYHYHYHYYYYYYYYHY